MQVSRDIELGNMNLFSQIRMHDCGVTRDLDLKCHCLDLQHLVQAPEASSWPSTANRDRSLQGNLEFGTQTEGEDVTAGQPQISQRPAGKEQ